MGDTIDRAKAMVAFWQRERAEQQAEKRFDSYKPDELIQLAETGHDLDGRPLRGLDHVALENAWRATFGEPLHRLKAKASDNDNGRAELAQRHPLFEMPDDKMLRPKDVTRILGIPPTTRKRMVRDGQLPKPVQLVPGKRHIGWSAKTLKAWYRGHGGHS